jgi:hypothetical protein
MNRGLDIEVMVLLLNSWADLPCGRGDGSAAAMLVRDMVVYLEQMRSMYNKHSERGPRFPMLWMV